MKKIKFLLFAILILASSLISEERNDIDGFNHSITRFYFSSLPEIDDQGEAVKNESGGIVSVGPGYGFVVNNEDINLKKRVIDDNTYAGAKPERKVIYGDIEVIGASVIKPVGNDEQGRYYNYEPILSDSKIHLEKTGITTTVYEKEDSSYSINSSKAVFDFSDRVNQEGESIDNKITGDKVIFARLYWGGIISEKWPEGERPGPKNINQIIGKYFEGIRGFHKIRFGYPNKNGGMDYATLVASHQDTRWISSFTYLGFKFAYQASYDVTDIVKKSLGTTVAKRTFSAGDIKIHSGKPVEYIWGFTPRYTSNPNDGTWSAKKSANQGGWTLVIVYDFGKEENHNVKPKRITIYDGMRSLSPLQAPASIEIHFEDFYTPKYGKFDSALTILSFGGAKEILAENIQLKKNKNDEYNDDKSVYNLGSNPINPKGSQFNSTISRFGKHMNPSKVFNSGTDLDTYDISSLLSNKQTEIYAKFTANVITIDNGNGVSTRTGDAATIPLVAFSTDLYVPNVCYEEKLFYQRKNDKNTPFQEVSKNKDSKTVLRKDDILRVELTIKNKTNEDVDYLSIIANINPETGSYVNDSTYVHPYSSKSNFILGTLNKDNANNLQKKIANGIGVNLGQGASEDSGGHLYSNDNAFIRYDIKVNEEFKENTYKASFKNKDLNLNYTNGIIIDKCKQTDQFVTIFNMAELKAVNQNFKKKGDSEQLYTQLAGEPFSVKIAYMDQKLKNGETPKGPLEELKVDVEVVENCDGESVIPKIKGLTFNKDIGVIEIPKNKLIINNAYPFLTFRLSYKDSTEQPTTNPQNTATAPGGKIISDCLSDRFAVRPQKFRMYDFASNKFLTDSYLMNLIGGRNYKDIGVVAVFKENNIATEYNRVLETKSPKNSSAKDIVQFVSNPSELCKKNINPSVFAEIVGHEINANFSMGKAKFYKSGAINFSYPDIGPAKLTLQDSAFTAVDHSSNDCIVNSDSTEPNADGKIGCNTKSTFDFHFLPNDILIDNVAVSNFQNNMTYTSKDAEMYAKLFFHAQARIDDDKKSIAKLYTQSCYAKNVNFTIDIDSLIPDYKQSNDGTIIKNVNDIKQDILFFDNDDSSKINKIDKSTNKIGEYQIKNTAFSDAEAVASGAIRFNFDKNIKTTRNPFAVNSKIFTFNNISDSDSVKGAAYIKPDLKNETNANFYYGRVHATEGKGPKKGFKHNVYFGIYCNLCDKDKYAIAKNAKSFPDQINWFINEKHDNANLGQVKSYTPNSKYTQLSIISPITKGVEVINLSSSEPGSDTIKMEASSWLLFNEIDNNAKTNDFIVNFTDSEAWGGQSLNKKGKNTEGVGSIVGGKTLPSETNRRLEW